MSCPSQTVLLTIIFTLFLILIGQPCDSHVQDSPTTEIQVSNNDEPSVPAGDLNLESVESEDDADDDGGEIGSRRLIPSTAFTANGRYHRRSTTTRSPNSQQSYSGQSTTSGSTNFVPSVYSSVKGSTKSSETAIKFPDAAMENYNNRSNVMHARGGVHGSNNFQGHGAKRGNKVPLNFLRKLSNENDVSQIFSKYVSNVKVQNVNGQKVILNLQGDTLNIDLGGGELASTQPSSQTTKPKITGFSDRTVTKPALISGGSQQKPSTTYAGCEPELQTVELPPSHDPSVIQYPRCVRLERCGGCCATDLLSCEAIMTKTTDVQVQKFSYNDDSEKLEYKETETVPMTVDVACRCNCKVKSRDCTPRHEYSSDDCACNCKNTRERDACLRQHFKLWDPNLCQCVCREILACSSGYSFNLDTCQCARIPDYRSTTAGTSRTRRRSRN